MAFLKIINLELFEYSIQLKYPIILKEHKLSSREGFLLKITDEKGRTTHTDIAPLPHFSSESKEDVIVAFKNIKNILINSFWSLPLLLSFKNILYDSLSYKSYPSLFFGLEFGLLSLLMPINFKTQQVPINGLLMGDDEQMLSAIKNFKNYSKIKVKVGSRSPKEFLNTLDKLMPSIQDNQKLRLDINRQWNLKESVYFCHHFPKDYCDYIEEPLNNPFEYLSLSEHVSHPIAFDESIFDVPLEFLLSLPTKKALVIKPTLMGSLKEIKLLLEKTIKHNMYLILSSSFESGLGHLMIAHLNEFLGLKHSIGLDTYRFIEKDLMLDQLILEDGFLHIPTPSYNQLPLNFKKLNLINV